MDYNEYNSNGERKKISFDLKNKQSRSRAILLFYALLFIFLVIFIRLNYKGNINNSKNIENNNQIDNNNVEINKEEIKKEEVSEIDSMFSFIDLNNYNFKFIISYNDVESVLEGKRYDNKYDFTLSNNNEVIFFNGTSNYMKVKTEENESYKLATLPFVLLNFFDNDKIKEIITNSELDSEIYKITNAKLSKVLNEKIDNEFATNDIALIKKNNKVTKINMDLTNAISAYSKENVIVKLNLEYFDFGLVDDFKIF